MQVQPYLFFNGRCEEAIEFYKSALNAADVQMMRYKDSPEPAPPGMLPAGSENKVMHACFRVGDSTVLASDGNCGGATKFEGVTLTLIVPTTADAERFFNALGDGGQVQMPLTKTFFSPSFGMVADRFGVSWMIYVATEKPA
jgi:PhnB protein